MAKPQSDASDVDSAAFGGLALAAQQLEGRPRHDVEEHRQQLRVEPLAQVVPHQVQGHLGPVRLAPAHRGGQDIERGAQLQDARVQRLQRGARFVVDLPMFRQQ